MINTFQMLAMGATLLTASCPPVEAPEAPQPKAPCTLEVILIDSLDAETPCDVSPPQMLAARIDDDPGPVQETICHDHGGRVFHDPVTDAFYCLDIDY